MTNEIVLSLIFVINLIRTPKKRVPKWTQKNKNKALSDQQRKQITV